MIQANNVTLRFGKKALFEEVNIKFTEGNCYGIIGANGAGKSTFLKILSGELEPTQGDISITPGQRLSVLEQDHFKYDDCIVLDTVIMGNQRLYDIMKEKDAIYAKEDFTEEDGIRASELEGEFATMNGWEAESDAATLLNGLNIDTELHYKKMSELSGSEKVKVLLARALFGNPDILLLDEPTNHLDLDAIRWLEEFLINFENTIIVVSHDRYFLNKVCTHTVDIDYAKMQLYAGNYDFWYESSQLMIKQMKEANKKKEEKIKELQDFIQRFSANASKSKQATSRKRALEKIELDTLRPSSRKYPYVDFKPNREIGNEVLTVTNLSKTIDGEKVLDNVSFTVGHDDKIAFVGSYGIAATTLFQILAGEMEPDEGEYLLAKMTGYNTKLYHDALTGIYNRRYYEDIARNMSGPSGVAIMDLDDFKVHNDTYGHHGGDIALEVVADVVKGNIRKCDSLIRFGGDEFLLILANMPEKTLKKKLEKIRDQVHAAVIHECPHLRVSVSIGGVAQGEHETMDSAVRRADRLLYHAKTTKNEVVVESDNTLSESVQTKNYVKPLILIVDDCDMNREILREILSSDYSIMEACGGEEALSMIHQFGTGISLVLLDIVMPGLDGFEVLSYMNQDHTIEDIPVIMISSEDSEAFIRRAYEMGASDYVSRPFDAKVVYRRVTNNIKLYAKQRRLIRMVTEQIREREENVSMLVGVLSQIVEFRNGESGLHVKHIRRFTECILDCLIEKDPDLHLGTKERENIPLASALHDIGKIAVDDKILNKPGRLTPEEFEAMKLHTVYGAKMLEELQPYYDEPLLKTATDIAHWHHERWDGRGYPDGLVGDAIPLSAQIVSLADVYDALTSERCYKKAYSHDKAVEMILNGECGVFNPKLVECFVEIQNVLREELCNVKYRDEQK